MKKNKRRILISAALSLTLVFTAGAGAVPSYGASDLSGHWAESIINEASALGIVAGYEDGSYQPEAYIKREEFYTLLTKIMTEKPDTANTVIKFPDVVKGEWYEPVIKTAVAAGIASGYEDGTFGIGRLMSRQEAAKVVASVITTGGIAAGTPGADSVKDVNDIGPWAKPYVDIMFQKKFMKGDDQGMLHPTNALKRCEAITILLNIKKNEKVIASNTGKKVEEEQPDTDGIGCRAVHSTGAGIFTSGDGTKRLPYGVKTEEQLDHIRMHVGETEFFVLESDISIGKDHTTVKPGIGSEESDWSAGNFSPIGTVAIPFRGNLDGNDHTVSGLDIKGVSAGKSSDGEKSAAGYAGLFGVVDKEGSVTGLTVEGSVSGGRYTGGISGYNNGTVENCTLGTKGKIYGGTYTGGVTGYSSVAINSNFNRGTVEGTGSYTGGVSGYVSGGGELLSKCINYGTVSGTDKLGGIAGGVYNSGEKNAVITDCRNEGTVNAGSYNAGGIIGTAEAGSSSLTVEDCINKGEVKGGGYNGGIVGILTEKNVTVSRCTNEGTVDGNGAGGIVGSNQGMINGCSNEGTVNAKQDGGGIAAMQQETGRVTMSYNEGEVNSDTYAGGIVGENDGYLDNCYNRSEVTSDRYAGGIAGRNKSTVANAYNAGTVDGELESGTIAGRNTGEILTSYWLDTTGRQCVGMADRSNGYDPLTVRQLTHKELSGQDKFILNNKYVMISDLMNKNNLSRSDIANGIKPTEVWKFTYSYTPAVGSAANPGNAGDLPQFDLMDEKNKPGNIIDSSELNDGTYLYPELVLK